MTTNKKDFKIETTSEWSSKSNKPTNLQWRLHTLFLIVSYPLLIIGSLILKLSNILMFDTHHLEINVIPKQ